MKHIFTISLCFLALSLSAQETITYPYNPDGDADGLVAVPDIQDLLAVYGNPFSPAEIMVGDTALSEWIQILSQALEDQQEVIEAMQGAGRCDIEFPEGLDGTSIIWSFNLNGSYTVPEGKNLYVLGWYNQTSVSHGLVTNNNIPINKGAEGFGIYTGSNTYVFKEGDTLEGDNFCFSGYLVENIVEPITFDLSISTYEVPSDRKLILLNILNYPNHSVYVNNIPISAGQNGMDEYRGRNALILKEFDVISTSTTTESSIVSFNGYLVDEDYFADCGGGGSGEVGVLNNLGFGEFEDITTQINENLTNEGPYPEFQQEEDGFLYIFLNPSTSMTNRWFQLGVDTESPLGYDFMNMMSSGKYYYTDPFSITPIIFPINAGKYWSVSAHPNVTVWKAFWIPIESEPVGSSGESELDVFYATDFEVDEWNNFLPLQVIGSPDIVVYNHPLIGSGTLPIIAPNPDNYDQFDEVKFMLGGLVPDNPPLPNILARVYFTRCDGEEEEFGIQADRTRSLTLGPDGYWRYSD